jgi:hypothetical protein
MLDKLGGGMFGALGDQMQKMQADLERQEIEGSVAGGKVRIKMNGAQHVMAVRIDPVLMNDREMLEDFLAAALNDAVRQSKDLAAQQTARMMASMGLPPGMF